MSYSSGIEEIDVFEDDSRKPDSSPALPPRREGLAAVAWGKEVPLSPRTDLLPPRSEGVEVEEDDDEVKVIHVEEVEEVKKELFAIKTDVNNKKTEIKQLYEKKDTEIIEEIQRLKALKKDVVALQTQNKDEEAVEKDLEYGSNYTYLSLKGSEFSFLFQKSQELATLATKITEEIRPIEETYLYSSEKLKTIVQNRQQIEKLQEKKTTIDEYKETSKKIEESKIKLKSKKINLKDQEGNKFKTPDIEKKIEDLKKEIKDLEKEIEDLEKIKIEIEAEKRKVDDVVRIFINNEKEKKKSESKIAEYIKAKFRVTTEEIDINKEEEEKRIVSKKEEENFIILTQLETDIKDLEKENFSLLRTFNFSSRLDDIRENYGVFKINYDELKDSLDRFKQQFEISKTSEQIKKRKEKFEKLKREGKIDSYIFTIEKPNDIKDFYKSVPSTKPKTEFTKRPASAAASRRTVPAEKPKKKRSRPSSASSSRATTDIHGIRQIDEETEQEIEAEIYAETEQRKADGESKEEILIRLEVIQNNITKLKQKISETTNNDERKRLNLKLESYKIVEKDTNDIIKQQAEYQRKLETTQQELSMSKLANSILISDLESLIGNFNKEIQNYFHEITEENLKEIIEAVVDKTKITGEDLKKITEGLGKTKITEEDLKKIIEAVDKTKITKEQLTTLTEGLGKTEITGEYLIQITEKFKKILDKYELLLN